MDEKDETLPMDQTDKPELVDQPTIQHDVKAEPEPQAEETPEPKEAQPRGPDGKFASKEEKGDTPETAAVAPPATEPENVPVKALQEERRKRQEAEDRARALEAQFAQFQQQPPPKQEAAPEFWDDPQGFMARQFQEQSEALLQRFQQQQQMERLNASEAAAKVKYADYDDAFRAFQQAASASPSLVQRMTAAGDPAEFAYKTGKTALELERVGSMDELLAQKRAEWEAEVKAAAPAPRQTFPTSTASDGSAASRGGPVWSGPTPDKDLLPMG